MSDPDDIRMPTGYRLCCRDAASGRLWWCELVDQPGEEHADPRDAIRSAIEHAHRIRDRLMQEGAPKP